VLRPALSARALADIRAQVRWYNEQNAIAAGRFLRAVSGLVEQIAQSPRRWPVFNGRVRRAMLRPFPYWIYYRDDRGSLEVIAVVHVRRSPDAWREPNEKGELPD
jgi:plasmid stabilization system protein ParE